MNDAPARVTSAIWVGALRRRVEAAGGFATVIAKGDADAGAVVLLVRDENGLVSALSKVNAGSGKTAWQTIFEKRPDGDDKARDILEKRRAFDPDIWIVELDVADPARFIDGDILET